jgi:D-aminopeptidase
MDVLISVDMEGVAGIATRQQTSPDGRDYPIARALMTAEANAAIAGAFDGGATSVVVNRGRAAAQRGRRAGCPGARHRADGGGHGTLPSRQPSYGDGRAYRLVCASASVPEPLRAGFVWADTALERFSFCRGAGDGGAN